MNPDSPGTENDANLSGLGRALLGTGTDGSKPSGPWVPPTPEELAKLLPDYEIVRMLGRGGMGAVYMGRQKSLDRPVAIKILSTALEDADPSFAERFKNEARAMGKLSHTGIVAVHDFGEAKGGLLYIVMEYVKGTDVARMIATSGRLHSAHAMAITAHVCDALAYAHERGIIHRDIKPANIMVGYDGVVKVADFGLAKMTHSQNTGLTQSGMAMGTLHYMAPEALMLGTAVDHRADIYAVGVMLYQMLTGKLPQGIFRMPSLLVPGIDPRYDGIIAKAVMEDREARCQTAREMRRNLDGILTRPVAKVEADVTQVPAAPPAQASPQRPAGQPYRPPQAAAYVPLPQSSSGWLFKATLGVLALSGVCIWMTMTSQSPVSVPEMLPSTPSGPQHTRSSSGSDLQKSPGSGEATVPRQTKWKRPISPSGPAAAAVAVAGMSPPAAIPSTAVEARQMPEVRTRVVNYQKARHAKLKDVVARYHTAVATAQNRNPADAAVYDLALGQSGSLCSEIEKNLSSTEVMPLPALTAVGNAEPPLLVEMRDILEREIAALEGGFISDLDQSLAVVQQSQTQGGREPAAKAVENYRNELAAVRAHMTNSELRQTSARSSSVALARVPATATKNKPFVNSLGMKFVPIRIQGGPTDGKTLLFSVWETRHQDYTPFVKERSRSWMDPNFVRGQDHPVVNVTWHDAVAFSDWLTQKDRASGSLPQSAAYRLPSDHEWSCAAGLGATENAALPPVAKSITSKRMKSLVVPEYPWGWGDSPPRGFANYQGTQTDAFHYTSPAGSFPATPEGLHDLWGNASEWCSDWHDPASKKQHVIRGHSWGNSGGDCISQVRMAMPSERYGYDKTVGFRVVIELP